jgi:hypothetical protein
VEPIVFSRISGVFVQYADQHSYRRLMSYLYNLVNCRSSAIDTILAPRSGFDENWQFKVDDEIIDLAVKCNFWSIRVMFFAMHVYVGWVWLVSAKAFDTPAASIPVFTPRWPSGRPSHPPFGGLLSVHSRCGLHTRAVTNS